MPAEKQPLFRPPTPPNSHPALRKKREPDNKLSYWRQFQSNLYLFNVERLKFTRQISESANSLRLLIPHKKNLHEQLTAAERTLSFLNMKFQTKYEKLIVYRALALRDDIFDFFSVDYSSNASKDVDDLKLPPVASDYVKRMQTHFQGELAKQPWTREIALTRTRIRETKAKEEMLRVSVEQSKKEVEALRILRDNPDRLAALRRGESDELIQSLSKLSLESIGYPFPALEKEGTGDSYPNLEKAEEDSFDSDSSSDGSDGSAWGDDSLGFDSQLPPAE